MKHINTTATQVGKIKSAAKLIKVDKSISLSKALDVAAIDAGYNDFHHVSFCAAKTRDERIATKPSTILRVETISLIKAAIRDRKEQHCVIALVGEVGSGKSIVVSQLLQSIGEEVTLYDPHQFDYGDIPALGKLKGISVIDDAWCFPNTKHAIMESIRSDRDSVIIVVCVNDQEAHDLCGDMLTTIIPIVHWQYLING